MPSCATRRAREAIAAGVVDEIDLQLSPVILGSGERLFDGFEAGKPALELARVLEAPDVVSPALPRYSMNCARRP
jgi:riboflavin biosynthesis pyrimidine reductase